MSVEHGIAKLRLLQDVCDALEAGGDGFEIRRPPDFLNALQPCFEVEQIRPASGHASTHFVVSEATNIAEVVFDAVAQELAFERRRFDPALHNNPHDAL